MIQSLRSEYRKLLSVRSTYVITLLALAITALINFWIEGYKNAEHAEQHATALLTSLTATLNGVGLFASIVAVLMIGHEYRYNTITYSLTAVNRRWKLLAAKYLMLASFTLVFTTACLLIGWMLFQLGLSVGNTTPVTQSVPLWPLVWHAGAYVLGLMSFSFIVTTLLRNLIGAIVFVLIVPGTIESLLGLLLKENSKYLPYTALGNLTSLSSSAHYLQSLLIVLVYVVGGGAITYWLFQKRDAN